MPSICIEKLKIFNILWDQEIKPNHSNFKSSVVSEIEKIIAKELKVKISDVSPETRAIVDNLAGLFSTRIKPKFVGPAVCILYFDIL